MHRTHAASPDDHFCADGLATTRSLPSAAICHAWLSYPFDRSTAESASNHSSNDTPFSPIAPPTRFSAFGYHSTLGSRAFPLMATAFASVPSFTFTR